MSASLTSGMGIAASGASSNTANTVYTYNGTAWDYWHRDYYPLVIRESYPMYLQERSMDKGKQAFEILKLLQDKKLITLDKVSDFIDAMDALIKVL